MAHVEILGTMVYQLMDNASIADIKAAGLDGHYADHGQGSFLYRCTQEILGLQLIFKQKVM